MRSLKDTISLLLFLLIYIVCVAHGNLQSCLDELLLEFKNKNPMDDFLIAFMNIKYVSVGYSKQTKDNEELYHGNYDLSFAARGYYLEMYYVLQDMDLPLLLSPLNYCRKEHRSEEGDCIRDIANIGCEANVEGVDCLKHLYIHWKQTLQPDTTPGTAYVSDKKLLEAIYRGSDKFCNLSDEDLIETLYRRPKTINKLSDENLLTESGFVPLEVPELPDFSELRDIYVPHFRAQPRRSNYEVVNFEKFNEFLAYSRYVHESSPSDAGAQIYDFDEFTSYTRQNTYFHNAGSRSSNFHAESSRINLNDYPSSLDDQNRPISSEHQDFLNYKNYRQRNKYNPYLSLRQHYAYTDYLGYKELMESLKNNDPDERRRSRHEQRQHVRNEELRQRNAKRRRELEAERNRLIKENETLRENHLRDARLERYGVADASYMDICKEYIRRKNTTRSFEYYYTMYIYDTLKDSSCGGVFQNCTDYCAARIFHNNNDVL